MQSTNRHRTGVAAPASRNARDGAAYCLNAPLDGSTVSFATSNPSVSCPLELHVTNTKGAFSSYKNHGDYVSSQGWRLRRGPLVHRDAHQLEADGH